MTTSNELQASYEAAKRIDREWRSTVTALEDRIAALEEELRIYKHRCLEAVRLNDEIAAQLRDLRARGKP